MADPRLGAKVRALRRREGLTQVKLAEALGISASYLNLIEHDKRPLPEGGHRGEQQQGRNPAH